ncbi:MAG: RNA polymerase factor sigma-54 [Treponema sp.]|jgi:RNA polymerase sigma-54 factor|nr:RNA polymerase factor sigma-54 [Treponema sp.]
MQIQRQSYVQEQRLRINPQFLQSIKLMELPIADLRERIELELDRNPALELVEDKSTVPLDDTENHSSGASADEYEYFESTSDPGRRGGEQASEEHRRFIEGALSRPETLQEHLLWQLQLESADDELRAVAEVLIQNLDDDGFHKEKPESLFPVIPSRLQEAMQLVRALEPAGTCASGYRESLLIQIGLMPDAGEVMDAGIEKILDNLELLERGKYCALAKKTGIDEEEAQFLCDYLKKFSPFPGRAFAPAEIRYVVPDIRVVRDKDEFTINLNDEAFPVLGINSFFRELGDSEEKSPLPANADARDFARSNIREARLFINHLNQRNKTLIRVTAAILEFQRSFFINGPKHLAPLTLGDIAREIDVHETTVSRTANGKYMQTEWGIYEIRYFFTNSISGTGSGGSRFSKESVKEIIKEIIASENRLLSDQEISGLLGARGIALARRTVAKYRKELDMGSSYTRRAAVKN